MALPHTFHGGSSQTVRCLHIYLGRRLEDLKSSSCLRQNHTIPVSEMTSILILLSIVLSRVIAKDCYNPDRSLASAHLPCVGNALNTHCCPPGSTCLTNGLCLLEDDASLSTGSCTERNWDELACFHSCFGGQYSFILHPPPRLCPTNN